MGHTATAAASPSLAAVSGTQKTAAKSSPSAAAAISPTEKANNDSSSSLSAKTTSVPSDEKPEEVVAIVSVKALQLEIEQLKQEVEGLHSWKTRAHDQIKSLNKELSDKVAESSQREQSVRDQLTATQKEKIRVEKNSEKELERITKEHEVERKQLNNQIQELSDKYEEERIDRELAEEQVKELEQALEEANGEIEILKSQVSLEQDSESPDSSDSVTDLRQQVERLKIALVKLRDLSLTEKQESAKKIKELEKTAAQIPQLEEKILILETENLQLQENEEELKEQLDAALEAEEIVEDLSRKNLDFEQQVKDLKGQIHDLEESVELSEQLEEQFQQVEKNLRSEIRRKEVQVLDFGGILSNTQQTLMEKEKTINNFRAKVKQLEQRIFEVQEKAESSSSTSVELSAQSYKLTDENLQLKNQVERLEAGLLDNHMRKIEASKALQKTSIICSFLPDHWRKEEFEAVEAQLEVSRLQSKCQLLVDDLKPAFHLHQYAVAAVTSKSLEDRIFGIKFVSKLETIGQLLASIGTQIEQSKDLASWLEYRKIQWELAPLQNLLDSLFELVKKRELYQTPSEHTEAYSCICEIDTTLKNLRHLRDKFFGSIVKDELLERSQTVIYNLQLLMLLYNRVQKVVSVNLHVSNSTELKNVLLQLCNFDHLKANAKRALDECRKLRKHVAKMPTSSMAHYLSNSDHLISEMETRLSGSIELVELLLRKLDEHFAPGRPTSISHSPEQLRTVLLRFFEDAEKAIPLLTTLLSSLPPIELTLTAGDDVSAEIDKSHSLDNHEEEINSPSFALSSWLERQLNHILKLSSRADLNTTENLPPSGAEEFGTRPGSALDAASILVREEINSIRVLSTKNIELKSQLDEKKSEILKKDQEIVEAGRKEAALRAKIEQLSKKMTELNEEIAATEMENAKQTKTWEDALLAVQEENNSLEESLRKLKEESGELQNRLDQVSAFGLGAEGAGNNSIFEKINREIDNLNRAICFLREENSILRGRACSTALDGLPDLPRVSLPSKSTEQKQLSELQSELRGLLVASRKAATSLRVVDISSHTLHQRGISANRRELSLINAKKTLLEKKISLLSTAELKQIVRTTEDNDRLIGKVSIPVIEEEQDCRVRAVYLDRKGFQNIHSIFAL